jgi:hypothetical protein
MLHSNGVDVVAAPGAVCVKDPQSASEQGMNKSDSAGATAGKTIANDRKLPLMMVRRQG